MSNLEAGLLADRVPYIRGGAGEREAVVFFGANALFKHLHKSSNAARYARHISRLLPGHKFTIFGYAGSTYDEIVQDMAWAMPAPPDVVVGISFGGFVSVRFAARHPELVRRLVILASAHRFSLAGRRIVERQFEALERGDFETLLRENSLLFRRPWYNWLVRFKLWKDRGRIADFRDPLEILRDCRQLFGPDFETIAECCSRVKCPTLIVGGTADQYFDSKAFEEMAELIPAAQTRIFDRETHMLPIERSGEVAAAISSFLAQPD